MASRTMILVVGFTGVRASVTATAVSRAVTGGAVIDMMYLTGVGTGVAGTTVSPAVTGQAVCLMVRFAVMGAMGVALVGASGIVRTARHPALAADVADGGVAVADSQTAGTVMLEASNRALCYRWLSTKLVCGSGYIDLTDWVCDARMVLALIRILIIEGAGATAYTALVSIAYIVVFAGDSYIIGAVAENT